MEEPLFIGVDVGTGSTRAALVNLNGKILKQACRPIQIWTPTPNYFQQSSQDIWKACCHTIKEITKDIDPKCIKGIGFDATCSLAVVDKNGDPVSISPKGEKDQNVIMWMDHRAKKEADFINLTKHRVLESVGGKVSLEMEIPKLLWLKKNCKKCWEEADLFLDLPDFLTWKATGSQSRSLCSVVCKWMYEATPTEKGRWNKEFFDEIGLSDLCDNDFYRIGQVIKTPGEPCEDGLSKNIAEELNLIPGIAVGTSIIDAHAGGLGLIGCKVDNNPIDLTTRLSLICGTSTCHMAVNKTRLFVQGVWGPYYSAMIPGLWLNEAGQSATGKLIDHIIDSHPATAKMKEKLQSGTRIIDHLNALVKELAAKSNKSFDSLTENIHIWPDFHGNRSPIADPTLKGMYGTRHIMEVMQEKGYIFDSILACGGLSKNELFLKSQANIVSKSVLIPEEAESVLIGAAILGATASGVFNDVEEAAKSMGGKAITVEPCLEVSRYHNKKYKVFKKMLDHQLLYQNIMQEE
ncbi:FGGY carbohydrate kinase domain-containing protein isoform X2 [Cimex lectularius]|uniref:FGGY carbohydrate kinase domain-containing protein n=1 Tax=Cimex lectularius TaxID=79782 RepID=A0A8I6RJM9_CIMLE|nr:FGGY carbohydrate kinase domain-containing protein isoform X2 [Cimex lectularius]